MIFIEGNVGSGKSTFLKLLEQHGYKIILEPVDEWTQLKNSDNKNLLENFYADQQRYAYTFQSIAFRTRIKNLKNYSGELVERSIFTDKNVFAKTCYENGKMNNIEWSDYCSWFDWLSDSFDIKPRGFIYLRADPEINYERIKKRSRSGEETIPFEYLQELHNKHDSWLMKEKNVLVLNVNADFEHDPNYFKTMLEEIKVFLGILDN
jgi:deoxyadenosine/deoxycytidine kinase